MKTKTRFGKFARRAAVATIGLGGVFSTGCDIEDVLYAMNSMGEGDKAALVSKGIRPISEPPVSRRDIGPFMYQRRVPGIGHQNLEVWYKNQRLINWHAPDFLPYINRFGSTIFDTLYIRNPISDKILQETYYNQAANGQIRGPIPL